MSPATVTDESALLSSAGLRARAPEAPDITLSSRSAYRRELRGKAHRLEVAAGEPVPSWLDESLQKLQEILELEDNWDSYGAPRVGIKRVQAALEVLLEITPTLAPTPSLVPTADGGVQIEWHRDGIDLEIEVVSHLRTVVYFADLQTGEEWEDDLDDQKIHVIRQRLGRMPAQS